MPKTTRRRITLNLTTEQYELISDLRRDIFPLANEMNALREILLHVAAGCDTVLQIVAKRSGYELVPIARGGHGPSLPRARTLRSSQKEEEEEEEKKKEKKRPRLAPLDVSERIIGYLNEQAGAKYRFKAEGHRKHLQARLAKGATEDEIREVIRKKAAEWRDTDMAKHLNPETLFGPKFEKYIGQPESSDNSKPRTHVERMTAAQRQGEWTEWDIE